jgi:hypothetical protein
MNIKILAKQWLIEHKHHELDSSFETDLDSLSSLIWKVLSYEGHIGEEPEYDPKYGDYKMCECGHPYRRHFDPYSNMDPVGCKYCHAVLDDRYGDGNCPGFKEARKHSDSCTCSNCIET